jgi:hypothetical protein
MLKKTMLAIVATVATFALIIGMTTIPYTQTAVADKDCNIGQAAGKQPGWGGAVSDEAKAGGVGGIFAFFNKQCHSD